MRQPRNTARLAAGTVAVLVLVAQPAAHAEETGSAPATDGTKTIQLLNINDFHGRITQDIGLGLAATVEQQRAKNPDSLLLSAGDNVSASLFVSAVQQDEPTLDYLNALGVQASAVGNHEFDKGLADLQNRLGKRANFPYLGANVVDASGKPLLKPYTILTTASGVKVAVVGAVTTETPQLTDPSALGGARFADPVGAVNKYADELRDGNPDNGEADVVVAEYHEGVSTTDPASDRIVTGTDKNVDAIFTGHTHQKYDVTEPIPGTDRTRPVIQTGNYGDNLADVELTLDGKNHVVGARSELIARAKTPAPGAVASDPYLARIQKILDDAAACARRVGSERLADLSAPVTTGYRAGAKGDFDQRDLESSMGHLVADMYKDAANSTGRTPADIGIVNPGGLRDEFPSGLRNDPARKADAVTVADANAVTPFANNLWTVRLTGAQLKQVLEEQWQADASGSQPTRAYLQLGLSKNVRYTYIGEPSAKGFAGRGHHVTGIWVNGKKVQDSDSFTVAIPSFLLGGGDNFGTFARATEKKDTAVVDSDGFQAYLKKLGTVTPRNEKQAVRVENLKDSYDLSGRLTGTVSDLRLPSLGAAEPKELKASIDGKDLGTVPVSDGSADLDLSLAGRGLAAGHRTLVLADAATGTRVEVDVVLTGADAAQPGPGTSTPGTSTPGATASPDAGTVPGAGTQPSAAPAPAGTERPSTQQPGTGRPAPSEGSAKPSAGVRQPSPSASGAAVSANAPSAPDETGAAGPVRNDSGRSGSGTAAEPAAQPDEATTGSGQNVPAQSASAEEPSQDGVLARTGADVGGLALGGLGLLALGGMLLARRLRTGERS